jgi:hypothetical protein
MKGRKYTVGEWRNVGRYEGRVDRKEPMNGSMKEIKERANWMEGRTKERR